MKYYSSIAPNLIFSEDGYVDCDSEKALYQCTQCGKMAHSSDGMLSCECTIAKPWKHIYTTGWIRGYILGRRKLFEEDHTKEEIDKIQPLQSEEEIRACWKRWHDSQKERKER